MLDAHVYLRRTRIVYHMAVVPTHGEEADDGGRDTAR